MSNVDADAFGCYNWSADSGSSTGLYVGGVTQGPWWHAEGLVTQISFAPELCTYNEADSLSLQWTLVAGCRLSLPNCTTLGLRSLDGGSVAEVRVCGGAV